MATPPQSSSSSDWTVLKILQWTTQYFASNGIDSPRLTAELLLAHVLDTTRLDLYLRHDQPLSASERAAFKALIQRRLRREPVAYILGERGFWNLDLEVSPDVLVPRADTETLVETALEVIPEQADGSGWTILDAGTGSGAIVLSLACERVGHRYIATDRSMAALRMARKNAERVGIDDVLWVCADWLDAFGYRSLDAIVSNPPYIPTAEIERLEPEVNRYEPRIALDGGSDGLDALRRIVAQSSWILRPTGWLFLEIGYDQGAAVQGLIEGVGGFEDVRIRKDLGGMDRVVAARRVGD
ncbi:MAG: peptide chain release factor N(5)-glutamine methyltransferase [Thermodesulfobacteriota bacterium]